MTYKEIYMLFLKQNPQLQVSDYRNCMELFDVPNMENAIVVWLKNGDKIIYQVHNILEKKGIDYMSDRMVIASLDDTVNLMNSEDYKERFVAEYSQTKIRYEKLKAFCNKIEVSEMMGTEPPKHDCPLELLREQQKYMGMYLSVLEKRAIIENIHF